MRPTNTTPPLTAPLEHPEHPATFGSSCLLPDLLTGLPPLRNAYEVPRVCVCVRVCVCERERERERCAFVYVHVHVRA